MMTSETLKNIKPKRGKSTDAAMGPQQVTRTPLSISDNLRL